MADILIKGLALFPEGYAYDVYIRGNGDVIDKASNNRIATAIELPSHGEAKDTDIAIKYIKSEMDDDFNETTTLDEKSYKEGMKRAIELIGYAPTIVEASK